MADIIQAIDYYAVLWPLREGIKGFLLEQLSNGGGPGLLRLIPEVSRDARWRTLALLLRVFPWIILTVAVSVSLIIIFTFKVRVFRLELTSLGRIRRETFFSLLYSLSKVLLEVHASLEMDLMEEQ